MKTTEKASRKNDSRWYEKEGYGDTDTEAEKVIKNQRNDKVFAWE